MNQEFINNPLYSAWPFWVLELSPTSTLADVEKSANELIGKLKFGVEAATWFKTPDGTNTRDEYLVREAKSRLQNPNERILAEFWYVNPEEINPTNTESNSLSVSEWLDKFGVTL